MASRRPLDYPVFQAFDDNGAPLSSGTVEFFDAGTTDQRNIYSDAALTTTAPNPVTLNSRGEPQSGGGSAINIYLDDEPYKIVLKDSDGATKRTIDNYLNPPSTQLNQPETLSDLQDLNTDTFLDDDTVYLRGRVSAGDGGEGHFRWDSSDLSTEVGNDEVTTNEGDGGIYIAPASDKTGASGAWVRQFTYFVDVKWYGATGDGTTDDTASLQAAYDGAFQLRQDETSDTLALAHGTRNILWFPRGIYLVSGAVNNGASMSFVTIAGEDAIIDMTNATPAFDNVRYMVRFEGLQFFDGETALSIKTGNTDTTTIDIDRCVFFGQVQDAIKTDSNSNSTLLRIRNSKFNIPDKTGSNDPRALNAPTCDYTLVENCWVSGGDSTNAAFFTGTNAGAIEIRSNVFVPGASQVAWVDHAGTGCILRNNRFGGENAGTVVVQQRGGSGSESMLLIQNNPALFVPNDKPIVQLFAIPDTVIIENNGGPVNADAVKVESGVAEADLVNLGSRKSTFIIRNNTDLFSTLPDFSSGDARARYTIPIANDEARTLGQSSYITSEVLEQQNGSSGGFGRSSGGNATQTTVDDEWGVSGSKYTATADDQNATLSFSTAFGAISTQNVTVSYVIEIEGDDPLSVRFDAHGKQYTRTLGRGKHVVSFPVYYDSTVGSDDVGVAVFDMPNGSAFLFSRWIVLTGWKGVQDRRIVAHDSAAPTSGQWYQNDMVWSTGAAASGKIGFVCTADGSPGTWKAFGAIDA